MRMDTVFPQLLKIKDGLISQRELILDVPSDDFQILEDEILQNSKNLSINELVICVSGFRLIKPPKVKFINLLKNQIKVIQN